MQVVSPSGSTAIRLFPGQSYDATFKRGALIRVVAGCVSIHSHVWLDMEKLAFQTRVTHGGVYCVAVAGHIGIVASSDAQLSLLLPQRQAPMTQACLWVCGIVSKVLLSTTHQTPYSKCWRTRSSSKARV